MNRAGISHGEAIWKRPSGRWFMAGRAGDRRVATEAWIEEKQLAELDLGRCLRVVGWHRRRAQGGEGWLISKHASSKQSARA